MPGEGDNLSSLLVAWFTIVGLLFGSFATAMAHRVPRGEKISGKERSKCPNCGATITARDNLPILSYIFLRGKCRNCGQRISLHYPVVELASALLFFGAAVRFEGIAVAVIYAAFFWTLVVLTVVDIEHKLLPDRIVFPAFALGIAALAILEQTDQGYIRVPQMMMEQTGAVAFVIVSDPSIWMVLLGTGLALSIAAVSFPWPPWRALKRKSIEELDDAEDVDEAKEVEPLSDSVMMLIAAVATIAWIALVVLALTSDKPTGLAGAMVGAGIFAGFLFAVSLFVPKGMGGGDVKLALVLGLFLGYLSSPDLVLAGMFLSFTIGGVMGLVIMLATKGNRKMQIPFGPYLAAGSIAAIFFGDRLIDLYLSSM